MAASFPTSFLVILIAPLIISSSTTTNSGSGDGCVADGISCFKSGHHHHHHGSSSSGGFGVGGLTGVAATSAVIGRSSRSSSAMTSTAVTTAVFMASSTGGGRWQGVAAESNNAASESSTSSDAVVAQSPTKPAVRTSLETYDEKQRLAVQVLGPGGGPHCAFSLVEFTNSHPTDSCIIHSTYIGPTVVFPRSENDMRPHLQPSSPIFNVDFPTERALHIGPKSTVVVPVSVFPHWRKPYEDVPHRSHHPPESTATTINNNNDDDGDANNNAMHGILDGGASFLQRRQNNNGTATSDDDAILTDTLDIIQQAPPSSETLDVESIMTEHEIHETIVANTSWGFFQMKVPSVCSPPSKEYEYGLPNSLIFLDGGGGWYARRNTTPTAELAHLFGDTTIMPAKDSSDPFVYNVYMNNPSDKEVHIIEVFTTMPDVVGMEMRCNKTFDANLYYPLIGSRILPGRNNIYVGTVRLFPQNIPSNMLSSMQDLGFLIIRTNIGLFATALDFIPNRSGREFVLGVSANYTTLSDINLIRDHIVDLSLKDIISSSEVDRKDDDDNNAVLSPPLSVMKSYRLPEQNPDSRAYFMTKMSQNNRIIGLTNPNRKEYVPDSPVLKVEPNQVDFGIITSGSRIVKVPIHFANPTNDFIRMIRMSVVMKTVVEEGVNITELANEPHRLEIGLGYADFSSTWGLETMSKNSTTDREDLHFLYEIMIPAHSQLQNALHIWCKFSATGEKILSRSYEGSIIFRVTHSKEGSSEKWEKEFVRFGKESEGATYATKVDFKGSIVPGSLGISPESLMFPTHYSMLSALTKLPNVTSVVGRSREYYDRSLEVINNFALPISITSMHLHESVSDICRNRFSVPTFGKDTSGNWPIAAEGEHWNGLWVRYHFQSGDENFGNNPIQCILTFETDKVGKQFVPLVIYSGNLIGEIEGSDNSLVTPTCFEGGDKSGLPCIKEWMETTTEGGVLRSALRDMHRGRDSWPQPCSSKRSLESYFRSLLSGSYATHFLNPVIVPFGPVSAGSIVSRSFYLTNLNPMPVEVTATTSVMGNMEVSIGHIPNDMSDLLNEAKGGDDLKYFLQQSRMAQDVFSKLQHKVDVQLSDRAKGGELESWFYRQRVLQTAHNLTLLSNNSEEHQIDCSGGFVLSTDGSFERSITSKKYSSGKVSIPAGGVARFEIALRIPIRSVLKNDVTPFVSSGLMLETNYGQSIPIITTYRALNGQLELKPSVNVQSTFYCGSTFSDANSQCSIPCASGSAAECPKGMNCWAYTSCGTKDGDTDEFEEVSLVHNNSNLLAIGEPLSIEVPIILRDVDNAALPHNSGISLSIESTFSHDILLSEVQSCNKWFTVFIPGINGTQSENSSQFLPIKGRNEKKSSEESPSLNSFGTVYSALSCSHPSKDNSFYSCALEWLEKRDHIQPSGCGLSAAIPTTVKSNAITALRDAVTFLSVRYASNSSLLGSDGTGEYMKSARVKMFKAARSAWNDIATLGLNIVTGDISAKSYLSTSEAAVVDKSKANLELVGEKNTPLTIPMPSVLLRSTLDIPKLFVSSGEDPDVLEFDTVHVGETTTMNVPVINPTGMTVRLRLTAAEISDEDDSSNVFVQTSPTELHPYWTGGSYWMSDNVGNLISATHNVTIKSGAGAFVSLLNPALHTMSAFVLGCGKRCAQNNEVEGTVEEKLYSVIGAASGEGSELFGQPYDKTSLEQAKKSTPQQILGLSHPPPFALGRTSLNEIVLPPYGTGTLGPVTFRPSSRSDFSGSFYIENSLTGSEEVRLRGSGGLKNLVFLDGVDTAEGDGGDVQYRYGRSALVFPGMISSIRSVVLSNQGDFPVKINSVSMSTSEVKHFTHKRRHPSLSFRPDGFFSFWSEWTRSSKCSSRGFSLKGCNDNSPLSFWGIAKSLVTGKDSHGHDPRFVEQFELLPNENKTFYVEHRADCSFMTSYASVIFEVNEQPSRHTPFRKESFELMVGFDMNGFEFSHCLPYSSPHASFWTKTVSITFPSLIRDVLSLGLTRLTDANGNPKIPNRPLQVSYLVAALILVLFVIAIDLLYWSEFPPEGSDKCSSWNSTCRCLARADPVSSDLVAIGKEQTKHVLLSRYRKEGVLSSHCVMSDGSFRRNKGTNAGVHNTFSDSIFKQHKMVHGAKINSNESSGALPGGLCWRTAFSRRIGRSDIPRTSSMMSRTRELYSKHQAKLQKAQKIAAASAPPSLATEETNVAKPLNGNSARVKPKKVAPIPPPQDDLDDSEWVKAGTAANGKKSQQRSDQQTKPPAIATSTAVSNQGRKAHANQRQSVESAKTKMPEKDEVETKPKEKQRNEVKLAKKDRTNKQDLAKDTTQTKKNKQKSNETATKNVKREANAQNDLSGAKAKQARQSKKANDAIKAQDQAKPKEGKQKAKTATNVKQPTQKTTNAKAHRVPKHTTSADFPPLSTANTSVATNVRPPPGLVAPPGFKDQPDFSNSLPMSPQNSSVVSSPTQSAASPNAGLSLADSSLQLPASAPALPFPNDGLSLGGMLAPPADSSPKTRNEDIMSFLDMRPASTSPPLMPKPQSSEDVQDLFASSNDDFNIGNFLDGILSDEPPTPVVNRETPKPHTRTESNPFQPVAAVPLDPWNNSSANSSTEDPLAALIGSTSTQGSRNDSSVIAGISLNSNAPTLFGTTIQNDTAASEPAYASLISDDGEKDNDTFLEPDSFYNQLLGE